MIFELGQNLKLCPHSNIIRQMIFSKLYLSFMFCIIFDTRYQQSLWCWKRFLVLTYFQDHYVEATIDEWCDFYVVLYILQNNHHRVYIATVAGIYVGSQGNVREKSGNFFLPTPWQPWCGLYYRFDSTISHNYDILSLSKMGPRSRQ